MTETLRQQHCSRQSTGWSSGPLSAPFITKPPLRSASRPVACVQATVDAAVRGAGAVYPSSSNPRLSFSDHGGITLPSASPSPQHPHGWRTDFHTHFNILGTEPVGQGEFGQVFLAQRKIGREVHAVKIMPKDRGGRSREQVMDIIRNEVFIWTLCHDNRHVVRLEGVFEDEDRVYLVQELCAGGDLKSLIKSGPLQEKQVARIMHAVLDVIYTCHMQQYSYGDVKPANFLLKYPVLEPDSIAAATIVAAAASSVSMQGAATRRPPGGQVHSACSTAAGKQAVSSLGSASRVAAVLASSAALSMASASESMDGVIESSGDLTAGPEEPCASVPPRAEPECHLMQAATGPAAGGSTGAGTSGAPSGPSSSAGSSGLVGQLDTRLHGPASASNICSFTLNAGVTSSSLAAPGGTNSQPVGVAVSGASGVAALSSAPSSPWPSPSRPPSSLELVVKAIDFGCSQHKLECSKKSKRMGSPVYMAPEMWHAVGYGLAADMWAAGVMMFQLLSCRYPFWESGPNAPGQQSSLQAWEVMLAVSSNPIHMSGKEWQHVSRSCKDLIMLMLDRNPSTRITALEALEHPWFRQMLGYSPVPTAFDNPLASVPDDDDQVLPELDDELSG